MINWGDMWNKQDNFNTEEPCELDIIGTKWVLSFWIVKFVGVKYSQDKYLSLEKDPSIIYMTVDGQSNSPLPTTQDGFNIQRSIY